MRTRRLRTRFILAGTTLVLTTVGGGLWSIWTFARLSAVVGRTLEDSQAVIDLTTAVAGSLEREDDALLLALSGNVELAAKQLARDDSEAKSSTSNSSPRSPRKRSTNGRWFGNCAGRWTITARRAPS